MSDAENLFADLPAPIPEELVDILAVTDSIRIERIVSTGQSSPEDFWYNQDEHEFVVVLKGEATLLFEDNEKPMSMKPGDFVNIPAHRKHRVKSTSPNEPTVWLAVFYRDR
ncbi:MAG: cupin domain-containing protein [Planctomycetota bacterium]